MPKLRKPLGRRAVELSRAVALGVAVFALAWCCITLTRQSGRLAAIWPINAVVLACLLRVNTRRWPELLGAALAGNFAADLACGDLLMRAASMTAFNGLEILVCAGGLRRLGGRRFDLRRRANLWLFAGLCGVVAPVISGLCASVVAGRLADPLRDTLSWVLSDSLGLLVLVPPLTLLSPSVAAGAPPPRKLAANIAMLLALSVLLALVFGQSRVPLLFLVPPALILVTFQMEVVGAALAVLLTAVISVTLVSAGFGPLTLLGPDLLRQMIGLQLFLLACAATALPVGATLAERWRVRTRLASSEARYRLLADNATDLILILDADGAISYASPSVANFGYAPAEVIGRRTLDFVHPDDAPRAAEVLRDQFLDDLWDPETRSEYRVMTKAGDYVWVDGAGSVLRDAAGRPTQVVASFRDVSARRRLEDQLIEARTRAEAASEAKSEFLANMSHEIRTPLTGVVGFAGLLEDMPALSPEAQLCVRRITSASQALLAVVNDILDFSKLEAGQLTLDPQPFDPAVFAREAVEIVAGQAREKGLTLGLELDAALPAAVVADSFRLKQVLLNLLGNAVKFTAAGRVTARVMHLDEPVARLRFEVTDTGPGVPADRLDRLFQRFSQVDGSISRRHGGTGLGLAICRRLTDLMGGAIGVVSREGAGSTFWFEVAAPVCDALVEAPAEAPDLGDGRPARLLIVDDLAVNRELVRAMLTPLGHECVEAASGAEAIELATGSHFDLILMDLQMPGTDGLAATRAIRASGKASADVPILALSANVLPAHVIACREAGMDDHIAKPIRAVELVTKVHHWLVEGRIGVLATEMSA